MVASSTIHIWIWENSLVGGNLVSSSKRWKEFHSLARKPYLISSYAYFDGVGLTNIVPSIIVLCSQGVSFTKFEDHLNDVDSPWHRETFFSTKLNGIAIGTHKSCATHFRNSCFNPWISLALWVATPFHMDTYFPYYKNIKKLNVHNKNDHWYFCLEVYSLLQQSTNSCGINGRVKWSFFSQSFSKIILGQFLAKKSVVHFVCTRGKSASYSRSSCIAFWKSLWKYCLSD